MRIIFHVDVNSAFLSWSAVEHLLMGGRQDYRNVPSAVAKEGPNGGGIILAKSVPAKKYGIKTGEVVWQAKQKCPELLLVAPNFPCYLRSSRAMKTLLKQYSPAVEAFSIDECFLDMTGQEKFFGSPLSAAKEIKDRIREELGFTVNIGIGANKAAAKMASEFEKPDRVHTLMPEEIKTKLWPEKIDFLFMAGRCSVEKLKKIGVATVGDMAQLPPAFVEERMGKNGLMLLAYANGQDDSPVRQGPPPLPKSISKSLTLTGILKTREAALDILFYIAWELTYKLREKGLSGSVLTVALKNGSYLYRSKQQRFSDPLLHYHDIRLKAQALFDAICFEDGHKYISLSISGLSVDRSETGSLFGRDIDKDDRLEQTVFDLKKRYGKNAVATGRSLQSGAASLFRSFNEDDFEGMDMPRFY